MKTIGSVGYRIEILHTQEGTPVYDQPAVKACDEHKTVKERVSLYPLDPLFSRVFKASALPSKPEERTRGRLNGAVGHDALRSGCDRGRRNTPQPAFNLDTSRTS